jgi:hypothetical protein
MKQFIIFLFFIILACEKNPNCQSGNHRFFEIKNNSTKPIYWKVYFNYPNQNLTNEVAPIKDSNNLLGISKSFKFYANPIKQNNSCWEDSFKKRQKEFIYFFDSAIIEKTKWEEVQKNGTGVLEVREIDLDYLIRNNFEVIYK